MSKKNNYNQNDEIDIFDLIKIIIEGKWKIVFFTFISFLIFFIIQIQKQDLKSGPIYEVKTIFKEPRIESSYHFNKLSSKITAFNETTSILNNFNHSLLQLVIATEFNSNKDLIIKLLEKNHDPQKNHNQDIINKNLNSLADKFKIILPTNENKNFYLNFNWYNYDQGKEIFDEALFQAKKNVRAKIIAQSNLYKQELETQNFYKLKELNFKLKSIEEKNEKINQGRILFLKEQAIIAKNLGIIKPTKFITQIESIDQSIFQFPKYDDRYYLIGYEALIKQMDAIKKRLVENNFYLYLKEYVDIELEIDQINDDQSINLINKNIFFLENDTLNNWSNYSWKVASISTIVENDNFIKFITFGILIGLFIGILYVLTVNAFQNHKKKYISKKTKI